MGFNARYGDDPEINAIWNKILEWKNAALAGGNQWKNGNRPPPRELLDLFEALDRAKKGKT